MKLYLTIFLFLIYSANIFGQKYFTIKGEIDKKMNNKTIQLYKILPSYSSIKPKPSIKSKIIDGKFNFRVAARGFEIWGIQIAHGNQKFNTSFYLLPKDISITFQDTLLKSYLISDDGFAGEFRKIRKEFSGNSNDSISLASTMEKYINEPFASYFLLSYHQKLSEGKISHLAKIIPDAYQYNSWYQDLEILIGKFLIGKNAPIFSQKNPEGTEISLSNFRGNYVLLDFWASWCKPCRKEHPYLVETYDLFKDKGFQILSVSLDVKKKDWITAIEADKLNWNHVSDLRGWNNKVADGLYKIHSIPQNFLIDPEGVIIEKNIRGEKLRNKLEILLKQ